MNFFAVGLDASLFFFAAIEHVEIQLVDLQFADFFFAFFFFFFFFKEFANSSSV